MHRESDDYRAAVRRKIKAYHAWAQLACITAGSPASPCDQSPFGCLG